MSIYPHSKGYITQGGSSNRKHKGLCEGPCGRYVSTRGLIRIKGKYLCSRCRSKRESFRAQQSAATIGRTSGKKSFTGSSIYTSKSTEVKK